MEIKTMQIEDINPAKYNPRLDLQPGDPEYEKIKQSIQEFGLVETLVWNKRTGNLVGGHQRLKVLKELGYTEAKVSVVDLPEEKEKALNMALNKIQGDWDYGKLGELLKSLEGEIDLASTGLDLQEIDKILADFNMPGMIVEDEPPELPEEPTTKPGDLWLLGGHRLLCGDATIPADVDRLMAGAKVDSLITDPPYGVDYSAKNEFLNKFDEGNRVQTPINNDNISDYREFFAGFLSPIPMGNTTRHIYLCRARSCIPSGSRLMMRATLGGDYLVWVKNNHVLGRKDYNAKHEFILYGWKNKHKFYGGFSTTVLEYDRPAKSKLHPTMKPMDLVSRLIQDGSAKGATIYDPFGGSGSTMIACEQLNRTCYMMELDPRYCDVIVQRWENFTGGKSKKLIQGSGYKVTAKPVDQTGCPVNK